MQIVEVTRFPNVLTVKKLKLSKNDDPAKLVSKLYVLAAPALEPNINNIRTSCQNFEELGIIKVIMIVEIIP